jgi:hypothetical protein
MQKTFLSAEWRNLLTMLCNTRELYGENFVTTLNQQPKSVFLAEGSGIRVMKGARLLGTI